MINLMIPFITDFSLLIAANVDFSYMDL